MLARIASKGQHVKLVSWVGYGKTDPRNHTKEHAARHLFRAVSCDFVDPAYLSATDRSCQIQVQIENPAKVLRGNPPHLRQ
jgi:hypothetical protein